MPIPVLDRDTVREVDRRAIEEYQIAGIVLMENAGRGCVDCFADWEFGARWPSAAERATTRVTDS